MEKVMKTAPAVFAVKDTYQIMVPVKEETLMWVRVGDECYYDDSNGILRSAVTTHRMTVPAKALEKEGKYTVCWRKIIERKPYFTETEDICESEFDFYPVKSGKITAYHIADAHNMVEAPVKASEAFRKIAGKIDFLILNGDIPDHSGKIENFDNIYEIAAQITRGNVPIVFSRGNHDTRGIFAENIAEHTPCDNGNSYFTFRLGKIWGMVLDCGEDKNDSCKEYGNTVCCHSFRKRETAFIESVIENSAAEYDAEGIENKIVVVHVPFPQKREPLFDIERDTYNHWSKLLRESIKPDILICGHTHKLAFDMPGCENDESGQPCPVSVGSEPDIKKGYFAGAGYIFDKGSIEVIYNDGEKVLQTHYI